MVNLYESRKRLVQGDWREQQTKEESFRKGRKYLLHQPGVITVKVLISDSKKHRPKTYYGSASTRTDVSLNFRELIKNAVLNAVMKHYSAGGKTSPQVELLNYKVQYFDEILRIKRESFKGKYFTTVRDRKSGKIIERTKWTRNPLKDYDTKNTNEFYKNYVEF